MNVGSLAGAPTKYCRNNYIQASVYRGVGCTQPNTPFLDVRLLPVNWAYLRLFLMNIRKWDMQSQ